MKNYRLLLLLFILCYNALAQDTQKVSLQLLWKHQFEFAGFYMAKEKGFYKKSGLDVEFKEYDFGIDIVSEVEQGKSTFGIGYPSIILNKANGAKINLLNAIFQSSPHALLSLKSSGIKSLKDFKGKRIKIIDDATKSASILSMLQSENVDIDSMKKSNYNYNIKDLIDNKTDIMTVFLSNEVYFLDKRNLEYNVWDPKDYGFDFYEDLLFTSTKMLAQNSMKVEKFRKASLEGWEYAFEHIDETIEIILKKYNTQNKSKEALKYEALKLKELAYFKVNKVGEIDKNKVQRIIDIYKLMGLTKNKIDIDEFIYKEDEKRIILTEDEMLYLKNNPKITVQNEIDWAPFNYYENNIPKGYSIDYMNLLAKKLNMNIEFINGPTWANFLNMIKNEKLDVMVNIVKTPERSKYINFTSKYKTHQKALFTNLDNITSLEDLKGKSIAVTKGFFIEEFIKMNYPNIKINTYDNTLDCIKAVIENKSDAMIESYLVVNHLLAKHNLSIKNVKLQIDERLVFDLRIGVVKNKPILKSILQKTINNVSQEELNTIERKWLITTNSTKNINKIDLSTLEIEHLKNKNTITMCIDPNWMPFEKFDNGKYVGISADYFKIFEQNLGKKIEVIPTKTWNQSLEYAKQRKCDLLSLAMETPKRKKFMNFTTPYLSVPLVITTRTDVTFINDIKDLRGKKIGIPKGYAFVEIFKTKYPSLNIIEVDNLEVGLERVKNGKLFGYIGTLASVGYMFQTKFTGELKIAGKFDEKWELGIGVRNDDLILLDIMEKVVKSIDKTQSQGILNNWLAIKYEQKVDYEFLWQILLIGSFIFIFFTYRQYILNKSNQNLQEKVDEKTKELQELNKNLELKIANAIEENRQKDQILFSQSKMASMGEMIGNIAHQWRQPLSVISTVASGMKLKIELDIFNKKDEIENLDILIDSTTYLSHTIDDFKNFLHPAKETQVFNIQNTIEKNLQMFGNSFTDNSIKIIKNIDKAIIEGNENELLQVIINILNNSKDALKNAKVEKKIICIDLFREENFIKLIIKDNAGGIEQDILPKVFDAYFTTKHKSMGTGIGLYMSYQIIQNSFNGTIHVNNDTFNYEGEEYIGAKFEINIPLYKK